MFNSTTKKRIQALGFLLLIIGSFTTIFNFSQIIFPSNKNLTNEENNKTDFFNEKITKLETADYSSSYSNIGGNLDINLHQSYLNNSFDTALNNSDSNKNKFAIPCPTDTNFNSSYTKFDIENINAPNKSMIVEDDSLGVGFESFIISNYYVSFTPKGVGYLENISLLIKLINILDPANLTIRLYNSEYIGGNIRPLNNLGTIVPLSNVTSDVYYWHKITNIHAFFNCSETYSNTFFLRVGTIGGSVYWDWSNDVGNDGVDEMIALDATEAPLTFGVNTIDFPLKLDFIPLNNTPKPSQIGLKINASKVTDNLGNSGYWLKQNQEYSDSDGNLDFVLTADWWDVTCSVSHVQINYTKTDLIANSFFNILGNGQSLDWNCTLGVIDNFDNRFNNYEINFTIPSKWENFTAFNGAIDKTSDINLGSIINNYRDLQILNADNGTNWYITAESENLLKTVHTFVNTADLSTMNYTDTINFIANFSEVISDGTINLSVYSPAPGLYLNHSYVDSSITPGSEISLGSWKISDDATEYGVFKVQVWWHNDTAGGFLEKDITIMAVTDLVLKSPPIDQDYFINDIFNITVFYNNTGLNLGDQGINGATINTNTTTQWYDVGSGYYNVEVNCSENDYSYGWNYVGIDATKSYYNSDSITFSFHLRMNTTISPSNTKDYGNVIRGTIIQYEFNYSDISGTPITSAIQDIIQLDAGFGAPGLSEVVNGNYTIQLDTSNVQASAVPYECIFNITKTGMETQNITIFLTVILSQTDLIIIDSDSYLIKKDGLNQTILFYFNDTDNNVPITGLTVDDVSVSHNQTGQPLSTWLTPNGTNGYYILNISVTALNSGWIELQINATFEPNYATSLETVVFYYQGNLTQTHLISVTDPGGEGTLTGTSNTYTCFVGRNLYIDLNITDNDNSDSLVSGLANSYLVEYVEVGNPTNQGSISNSLNNDTNSYLGLIYTSALTTIGTYEITVKVSKTDFETSILRFNVTLRALYIINISIVDKPTQITAGDSFHIIVQVEYYNTTNWLVLAGSDIRLIPIFDGTPGTPTSWTPTNATGEIDFEILTSNTITNITLTIEVQSEYFHVGDTKYVYDIVVKPVDTITLEDLIPYLIMIGVAAVAIAISVGVYKGVVVPKKQEKIRVLTEVKTIFDDAINLEHILVLYKATGTCIYFKSFGSEQIDPELISGFISAISSFGKDLVSQEELNEISYGDKMLLLSDGKHIRVALVLGKKASLILRRNLMEFIHRFEKDYSDNLPNWRGQLNIFREAGIIVDDVLSTSIILPHEITFEYSPAKALKKPQSQGVLKIAKNLMKDSERNFFFIATLLKQATDKTGKDTAEIFMGIKELRDRRILMPIEISAIEAKPISQQELNLINQKVSQLVKLTPEEKQKLVNDLAQMGPAEREAYFVSLTERHEIISAPIEAKPGTAVVENIKGAKKEIKNLKKNGLIARKEKDYDTSIKIFQNALKIASNWELLKESQEFDDLIRLTKIEDLKTKMKTLEQEARLAAKEENFNEAAQKYKMSSKIASEIFKLGEDLTKEVKRLSNKAKEYEKLV
ncbi:MAG: hypothetical protein ACFFAV_00680 [Candidatus Hermodarchaeota archaeon]